ncbi:MAG TPA: ATP-binding protein [Bryobacteraceae bacterium]
MPTHPLMRWTRQIRPQDVVWLLLFAALVATLPAEYMDAFAVVPLIALGLVQVLEPKLPAHPSTRSRTGWILLKMVLGFIIIGYTNGIRSNYWLVLLLPVVSAGSLMGILGTLVFTAAASAAYLSFLLFVNFSELPVEWPVLFLRIMLLAMVGNLANILAEDLRIQSRNYRRTAEQLAEANLHIQEVEEAVRRSDRLAALGQLSAGLAHELRNPLGTIKASAEMLARQVSSENEVAREVAGFISSEVDRTNSLVTRFLQFARPLQVRLETADLAQMLDRAIAAAEREPNNVAIYKNYDPEIPPFPFDAELMERVIYNLVVNAAQASPAGGAVTVKTRAAGGTVEIAVIDRGQGIDPKNLGSIFNPFFTTKATGVGLGLAIVSKIVDEHGGKIAVESEPGRGSVFRVLLPTVRAAAETSA